MIKPSAHSKSREFFKDVSYFTSKGDTFVTSHEKYVYCVALFAWQARD